MTSSVLRGLKAIEYATARGLKLNKYADRTENARFGLTLTEARAIAEQDPNLLWVPQDRQEELVASAQLWTRRFREATSRDKAALADRERRNAFRALYHYIYDNSQLTSAEAFKRAKQLVEQPGAD